MTPCETCGGEGTVVEFRRFAGEYMAGEPIEVECPDCEGAGEFDDEPEEATISTLTLDDLRKMYGGEERVRLVVERDLRATIELQRKDAA
jgi:hypothetical protein